MVQFTRTVPQRPVGSVLLALILLVAGLSIATTNKAAAATCAPPIMCNATGVSFGSHGQKLDWYYNVNMVPPARPGPVPAVLLIHGGCWIGGSKSESVMISVATDLANAGYFVVVPNYRLASRTDPSQNPYPAQYVDVSQALDWLLPQPNVDTSRVGVVGESAGGHLASLLGEVRPGAWEGVNGEKGVKAWYGASGAYDFVDVPTGGILDNCIGYLLAGSSGGDTQTHRAAISPDQNVNYTAHTSPALLTNYQNDVDCSKNPPPQLTPIGQMDDMSAEMLAGYDSVTTYVVPPPPPPPEGCGGGHALDYWARADTLADPADVATKTDVINWLGDNI